MMIEAVAPSPATARPSADERGYYSVSRAAALLGVSRVTIWRWIRAGRLPASRVGERTTRIARGDLDRILTRVGSDTARLQLVPESGERAAGGRGGEHVTQFYEEEASFLDAASTFIGAALRAGDAGVVLATEAHRAGLEERLRSAGLDLIAACNEGRYVALDAAETLASFMVDGAPDPERFVSVIGGVVAQASAGGRRVHAFGEMVALLAADGNHASAIRLEALWNDLQQGQPFSLLCAYPMDVFNGSGYADSFDAVCAEHSRIIPAEGYAAQRDADERLREIARLQQKARSLEAEIAERERAEVALLCKQRELDDFVENAVVGLHRVGPDGRILWANRAELDLLGYARDEYVGRPVADFHADPSTIADILRRLAAREELHGYPARLRRKDGSIRHVLISSNVLWEDGRFVHTRCFTRDVTERVRAEEGRALLARAGEVLASSLAWDATLDHVIDLAMPLLADFGFFDVVEPGGVVRRIARAHEDPRRQAILDASHWAAADHTELDVCALTSGRTGVHPDVNDAWLRAAAAGPEHLVAMRDLAFRAMVSVPLRHGGRTLGALTLFYADSGRRYDETDVALIEELARRAAMAVENARLYGEAQAAIRARDEFLSIASHELRNPVAGMKGAAQMLRRADERGRLDGERLGRYLGIIEQTADRLAVLTEDLLDVSRLRQGVLPLRPRPIDLAVLVGAAVARLQERASAHRLAFDAWSPSCPAVVDPDRIEQVLENLLGNAIKYAPGGGEIRVTLASEGDGILLSVRDAGIGLPPSAMEVIFEPFGRAPNALSRNIEGLGLGLYICRQIAEQHGGRLWVESDGEGTGTTLRLSLPATGGRAAGAAAGA
jgi:PAS domain S-box-containing protein/excisionase family DNA binding protein